jgi:hypothetical protein
MRSRANARGRVNGHSDVVRVIDRRVTAVDSDPHAHLEVLDPRPFSELTLGSQRRVKSRSRILEHSEELVRSSFDHVTEAFHRRASQDRPHVVDQLAVPVA